MAGKIQTHDRIINMIISEVIIMLDRAKENYGDVEVYVDVNDYQREISETDDPLCRCPQHEEATINMPERIVI